MSIRGGKYERLLIPISKLYGMGVWLRNLLFDRGILKEEKYPIPIICVGNIAVGGTGKTPHVEYIIRRLRRTLKVAVISRGYKRKSKGLHEASKVSTIYEIGDEPWQIKNKFPDVKVVVDSNRRRAIRYLLNLPKEKSPDVIILDDGFQHRYVKPSFSILLTDASKPFGQDHLLPYGDLRENPEGRFRADCIIVTKCPKSMQPIQQRLIRRDLNLYPHQKVFFSCIKYHHLLQISRLTGDQYAKTIEPNKSIDCVLIAGVANPTNLIEEVKHKYNLICKLLYPDHHNYDTTDIDILYDKWYEAKKKNPHSIIVCTEKDAVKLIELKQFIPNEMYESCYFLPIEITFNEGRKEFDTILDKISHIKPIV